MKSKLLLFISAFVLAQPALAQVRQWEEITRDSKGGIYYMRGGDLANTSDATPEVWIKGYHEADKTVLYRSSMTLYAIDCRANTYAMVEAIHYHADGRVRDKLTGSRYRTFNIVPDTIMDTFAAAACP